MAILDRFPFTFIPMHGGVTEAQLNGFEVLVFVETWQIRTYALSVRLADPSFSGKGESVKHCSVPLSLP